MKISASAKATVERAVTVRMSTELHKQLEELANDLGSNTTHVLLGLAKAGIKIIDIKQDQKLHLPKYLAIARLARTYSEKESPTLRHE